MIFIELLPKDRCRPLPPVAGGCQPSKERKMVRDPEVRDPRSSESGPTAREPTGPRLEENEGKGLDAMEGLGCTGGLVLFRWFS